MLEKLSDGQQIFFMSLVLLILAYLLYVAISALYRTLKQRQLTQQQALAQAQSEARMTQRNQQQIVQASQAPPPERRPRRQRQQEPQNPPVEQPQTEAPPEQRKRRRREREESDTYPTLSPAQQRFYYFGGSQQPQGYFGQLQDKMFGLVAVIAMFIIRAYFGLYFSSGLWDMRYHGAMMVLVVASWTLNATGVIGSIFVNFLLIVWALMMLF